MRIERIYNFMFPPAKGLLREVNNFYLHVGENGEKFLVSKFDESERYEAKEIDPPYSKIGKIRFAFVSSFLPILFASLLFFVGVKLIPSFSNEALYVVTFFYLATTLDALLFFIRLKNYSSGYAFETKNDFIKTLFAGIPFFVVTILAIKSSSFGFIEASSLFFNAAWYIVFVELIKKPLLIMFSNKIQFWTYSNHSNMQKFVLISPIIKEKE